VAVGHDGTVFIIFKDTSPSPFVGYSIKKLAVDGTFKLVSSGHPTKPHRIEVDRFGELWLLTKDGFLYAQ